jgi:hypothetical protein
MKNRNWFWVLEQSGGINQVFRYLCFSTRQKARIAMKHFKDNAWDCLCKYTIEKRNIF